MADQDITKFTTGDRVLNTSFDQDYQTLIVQTLGFDGQNVQRLNGENMAIKVTEVGLVTYVAKAAPGTAQSTAKWQVSKVDETTGTILTWADGNSSYDNIATDLTALSYS